jgi:hypothetical protein
MSVLDRWREFRRAQRDALRASNQPWLLDDERPSAMELLAEVLTPRHAAEAGPDGAGDPLPEEEAAPPRPARTRRTLVRPADGSGRPDDRSTGSRRSTWGSSAPSACCRRC